MDAVDPWETPMIELVGAKLRDNNKFEPTHPVGTEHHRESFLGRTLTLTRHLTCVRGEGRPTTWRLNHVTTLSIENAGYAAMTVADKSGKVTQTGCQQQRLGGQTGAIRMECVAVSQQCSDTQWIK